MCSFQTSIGTALTHRDEENRMAGAIDEDVEMRLCFWRLAGGGEVDEDEAM